MTDGFEEYDDVVVTLEERLRQDEFDEMIRLSRISTSQQRKQYKYNHSDKGRLARARYQRTDKFKRSQVRYRNSDKGKEVIARYRKSQSYNEAQKKYQQSEKGKENERRKRQRKIDSGKNAEYCRRYYYRKKLKALEG